MKKLKSALPYILIIFVAFFLRSWRYWEFPNTMETADEYAWTWLGSSILADGQPTSWSYFAPYGEGYIYKQGPVHAPLVRPAVDHPPLFAFIPGIAHLIATNNWETLPDHRVIRIPMLFLGTLAVALLGYWTSLVLEKKWSLVATAIYAMVPVFVFSSRLVVSENFLILLLLILGILVHRWENLSQKEKQKQNRIRIAFLLLGVAALLTKISGILIPGILVSYALVRKDFPLFKLGILVTIASITSLLLYASYTNFPLFMAIQKQQTLLPIGLSTLYNRFFIYPNIANDIYYDGWLLLGFFGFVYALIKKDISKIQPFWLFSILSTVVILGFIGITGGEYTFFGWYSYPILPFFALFITLLLKEAYEEKYLLTILLWFFLLPTINNVFVHATRTQLLTRTTIRMIYFLGALPLLISLTPLKKYTKYAQLLLFVTILSASILSVMTIDYTARDLFQRSFWSEVRR
ncbi:MAG: hypothetical protein GW762_05160 [Candidatus Pacebacteria bacterium]|nr:hypothetical protein [Candidatus Paceibacterota bacterium]PIR63865.1 MAG: hypothetical protein COU64_02745 [Candidatus Pacebacteria bacterium CG10_big_fil_rev_8_21_14_0_10_40_26]PIZ78359.1 MAG: hypothetical protein COY01_06285 [Candidatus Pacebacteria bacterium CG_4_10_14_0_2_um_filter_40_20]PJA68597.1 MAG: hypothetical protein CO156_03760 [Candidatus Pacebacteria bacterium CG_4_9_14_3_um_filter_40_12]PJC41537.1 MAG: hypothetical protein CO041_02350 [Candidatus Pacebacteria bacterium CG_4_9_